MQRNLSAVSDLMTHEGKAASRISPSEELRRSVLSCLLWEREFYEDGESIADRIDRLADKVPVQELAALAVEARTVFHLRHVPLLLLRALIRRAVGRIVSDTICSVIQRPDEMCELLSIYWLGSRKPLSNQMKKGLSRAFQKFTPHQLAKYNRRDKSIKLRDVLFLCHAKPKDEEQAAAWKSLVDGTLASPDTWEVALSSGGDKKETFERLIRENKLGYLALLRNLRTMVDVGCDRDLVKTAILSRRNGADKVLPFRFVAASRAAPSLEKELDIAMLASIASLPVLSGHTVVLVDVSASMHSPLSSRSDLTRLDAAASLASILNCESLRVFSFSDRLAEVPPRRGMSGVDAISKSQTHGGTLLAKAVREVQQTVTNYDRIIVISDEQASFEDDKIPRPLCERGYIINVASYENGIGYGDGWIHIYGFSEGVIRYLTEIEA